VTVHRRPARFATTRWTLVLAARDAGTPESLDALAELYQEYWPPLYAFLRRRGHSREDAEDFTHGFFTRLIERTRHPNRRSESRPIQGLPSHFAETIRCQRTRKGHGSTSRRSGTADHSGLRRCRADMDAGDTVR
jgi:hypothetical protein